MKNGYTSRELRRRIKTEERSPKSILAAKASGVSPSERIKSGIDELRHFSELPYAKLRGTCPFFHSLKKYVQGEMPNDSLVLFAEKFYRRYTKGATITELVACLSLLDNLASDILNHGRVLSDTQELPLLSGDIFFAIIINYFNERIVTVNDLTEMKEIRAYFARQGFDEGNIERRVGMIDAKMADMWYAEKYANDLSERLREQGYDTKKEKESYRQEANELFASLRQLRRYSIASSLYEDETSHRDGQGWVIMDPVSIRKMHTDLRQYYDDSLASLIFTSVVNDVHSIFAEISQERTSSDFRIDRVNFSFPSLFRWELCDDGEIYLHLHPVKMPLKNIFYSIGNGGDYEFLRLLFIAHLFDLVVPREISEQAPSLHNLRETIRQKQQETGESADVCIRKLVLPRKLILKNREAVQNAIDQSNDEGHAEVERRTGKKIEHRIGSPVRLREGYKRHPQAVEWAAEYGVTLKDNETWRQPTDPEKPLQRIVYKSTKKITEQHS